MIYHSVRLAWKPETTEGEIKVALDRWHKMAEEIPVVQSYCIGRDVGGEFDHGATFALENIAAYEKFVMHPAGKETDLVGLPLVQRAVSMDITDDEDPDIAEKINEIHRVRFERDPEVLDLVTNLTYTGPSQGSIS